MKTKGGEGIEGGTEREKVREEYIEEEEEGWRGDRERNCSRDHNAIEGRPDRNKIVTRILTE